MKFMAYSPSRAHDHRLETFGSATSPFFLDDYPVNVTTDGVAIFWIPKSLSLMEKFTFLTTLDQNLQIEQGRGLALVTSAASSHPNSKETEPYYRGVNSLLPGATTLWLGRAEDAPSARHAFEGSASPKTAILALLAPTDADRAEPSCGWSAFSTKLELIYGESLHAGHTTRPHTDLRRRMFGMM